jgi:hypothetical protein
MDRPTLIKTKQVLNDIHAVSDDVEEGYDDDDDPVTAIMDSYETLFRDCVVTSAQNLGRTQKKLRMLNPQIEATK